MKHKNPFIITSYIDRIVDNFFKEQMKDTIQNNILKWGRSPKELNLKIANCVDVNKRELIEQVYEDIKTAIDANEKQMPEMVCELLDNERKLVGNIFK